MKKIHISPDGQRVLVKSLAIKDYEVEYKFERLPTKLKPWYQYAYDFIRLIKTKTPKVIYANNLLKCTLMDNEPLPNVEIDFTS